MRPTSPARSPGRSRWAPPTAGRGGPRAGSASRRSRPGGAAPRGGGGGEGWAGLGGEDLVQDRVGRARLAVEPDQRRIPRVELRDRIPLVEVHAADARAEVDELAEDERDHVGGMRGALL